MSHRSIPSSFVPSPSSQSLTFFRRCRLLAVIIFWFSGYAARAQTNIGIILTQTWTPTGISVTTGEGLTIQASGTMNWYTGTCPSCTSDPNGVAWSQCATRAPDVVAPGLNCWSLIGRIGGGPPFEVGTSLTLTAFASGELELGVNDDYYVDNTGSWVATVTSGFAIASPLSGKVVSLSEMSYTASPSVTFKAAGAAGTVNWTAALEYQTSGGRPNPPFHLTRTFQTLDNGSENQTYASQGGQVTVTAESGEQTRTAKFLITGVPVPNHDITERLVSLYQGATPRLMTGVAQVESSYFQFRGRLLYGTSALWPYESAQDNGSHIGLMMMPTPESLKYAWDWRVNTQAGVTLFKAKLGSAKRLMKRIIQMHPRLRELTSVELEHMALVLYGPYASADLGKQYYAPARSGNGWTWIVNDAGNPLGVGYADGCFQSIHFD